MLPEVIVIVGPQHWMALALASVRCECLLKSIRYRDGVRKHQYKHSTDSAGI